MNANLSEAASVWCNRYGAVGWSWLYHSFNTHVHTLSHIGSSLKLLQLTSDLSCMAPKKMGGSTFNSHVVDTPIYCTNMHVHTYCNRIQ